jgi:hypothetical protein
MFNYLECGISYAADYGVNNNKIWLYLETHGTTNSKLERQTEIDKV